MDELTIQPATRPPGQPATPPAQSVPDWAPWTAPAALLSAIALAAVGGVLIDIPAAALGVHVTSSHIPGGLAIADTIVQDAIFVLVAVLFAARGGAAVAAWMFGLHPPRVSWLGVAGRIALLFGAVLAFAAVWSLIFHPGKEQLLEKLGANEGTPLLILSAVLTCVIAPMCEEFLFRGYFFTALRNWRGVWPAALMTGLVFGGVHYGSAPLADLAPLAALGFGLCLLYRYTGSLYPCIIAHALNNCLAFGDLESWNAGQIVLLMLAVLAIFRLLVLALRSAGVISGESPAIGPSA